MLFRSPGKGSFASANAGTADVRRRELLEKLQELVTELKYLGVTEEALVALVKEEKA